MTKPAIYNCKDMLSVAQVCRLIPGNGGGHCSRQHVYNLIDRGELSPAFRFGKRMGLCVPRSAVDKYISGCLVEVDS